MSGRRLLGTTVGMALIAAALGALAPSVGEAWIAVRHPQTTADTAGPDVLLLHLTGLLAWLVWLWGALGLTLTAVSALPGLAGRLARGTLHRVLPAGARRAAAVALGLGLSLAPPAVGLALVPTATASAVAPEPGPGTAPRAAVPDWPAPASPPASTPPDPGVPDWPPASVAGEHVVVRGDCLWHIAEHRLAVPGGREPSAAEVATAVHAWWRTNAEVIGPDPDRLLPGQVLRPPAQP